MGWHAGDAVAILIGASLIAFNRRCAEYQVRAQNQWGGFRMGPRAVAASRFVSVVVGAGFLAAGLLSLLSIGGVRG